MTSVFDVQKSLESRAKIASLADVYAASDDINVLRTLELHQEFDTLRHEVKPTPAPYLLHEEKAQDKKIMVQLQEVSADPNLFGITSPTIANSWLVGYTCAVNSQTVLGVRRDKDFHLWLNVLQSQSCNPIHWSGRPNLGGLNGLRTFIRFLEEWRKYPQKPAIDPQLEENRSNHSEVDARKNLLIVLDKIERTPSMMGVQDAENLTPWLSGFCVGASTEIHRYFQQQVASSAHIFETELGRQKIINQVREVVSFVPLEKLTFP